MNLTVYILVAIIAGAVTAGIILAGAGALAFKQIKKNKEAELAKELKTERQIEYLTLNAKQINKHLQLTETKAAKKLDSFDVPQEQVDNFVINAKAQREELTDKDKKKATKIKF